MAKKIFKYGISEFGGTDHEIPEGANVVHVGLDAKGEPSIWAEVNPDNKMASRHFEVFGTGMWIPDNYNYLGSYIQPPNFVWHIYERESK